MNDVTRLSDAELMAALGQGGSSPVQSMSDADLMKALGRGDRTAEKSSASGYADAAVRGGLQGVTLGWADEIQGAQAAGFGVNPVLGAARLAAERLAPSVFGQGGTEAYNQSVEASRAANRSAREQYPVTSFASEVVGGIANPLTRIGLGPATLGQRAVAGAASGAAIGGVMGVGQGEGVQDSVTRGLTGIAVGAPLGGLVNAAIGQRAAQAAIPSTRPTGQQVLEAAERQGVDVPRLIASDSTATQRAGQGLRNVPFAGDPIVKSTDRMVGQLGQRADDLAGNVPSLDAAGGAARSAIETTIKSTMPARAKQLYDAVDNAMPQGAMFPMSETAQIAADIAARRQAAGLGSSGALQKVEEALSRPGLTFQGLRDLRTALNEDTGFGAIAQGMSNAEMKQITGALSRDIDAAVAQSGPQAQRLYQRANQWYSAWAQRREELGRVLGTNSSDEAIASRILAAASSSARGDVARLTAAKRSMGQEWGDIASVAISRLGRDAEGNFSPARFITDYGKMSEAGKSLLFSDRALRTALDDIATISSRSREVQRFSNPSGTAQGVTGAGIGAGLMVDPITTLGTVIGGNVLSRVLASPATAASAAKWSRAYAVAVQQPTAATLSSLNIASRNLSGTLGERLGVSVSPEQFLRAIQGAGRSPAEGDPQQRP